MTRLLRFAFVGMAVAWVVGAVAALRLKQRLVPTTDPAADTVLLVAIFGPLNYRSRAAAFRGGRLEAWYGGGVIDLRGATLDSDGAHLAVRVVFGGGQIAVPESWRVTTWITGPGGVTDSRPPVERPPDAPQLIIEGIVAFGGLQITTELSAEAERELGQAPA